jgi:preprotein translocase subunit SecG
MQNSKGGGISSDFSTVNQIIGVNRSADQIEKITWTLAGIMIALSILLTPKVNTNTSTENSESTTRKKAAGAVMPQTPAAPTQQNNQQPANNQPTK